MKTNIFLPPDGPYVFCSRFSTTLSIVIWNRLWLVWNEKLMFLPW